MPKKKSSAYWKKRFEQLEQASHSYGTQAYMEIEPAFTAAQRQIQAELDAWYARFAANNNVTLAEARRMLSARELAELKWDVQEYIKYGQQNALDGKWMKELENASARFHISRLEALQLRTQQALEVAFGNELDAVDRMTRKVFTEDYYHSIFEVQKGFNLGWQVGQVDEKQLDKIVKKPWSTDGKNFSDRIWSRKQQMIGDLHQELTRTLVQGKAPDEAIKHMTQFVDGKVKNAKSAASRLVMTEQAYFHSVSQQEAFKDLDVEEFEVVATLDSHTSEICQEMDGKHFPMTDYEPGVTAPPFHPNCRSVTAPFFDDEWSVGERAARGEDGKTYYVPSNMTYPEWKQSLVDGHTEDLKPAVPDAKVKAQEHIDKLEKLQQSGMDASDYDEYLEIINQHSNPDITRIYKDHADEIVKVKKTASKGEYSPASNSLSFDYPQYSDMNKYGTLAHEYGHFFDAKVQYDGVHYTEIQAVQNATGLKTIFKECPSSSDEFLAALRKDRTHIRTKLTPEAKADLIAHNTSHGVQDAIDGLFSKSRIKWGHGERYYNRKFSDLVFMDKMSTKSSRVKALQQVYKDLGLDASNQAKTKMICRQYEAASEMWANIMSAEVIGGEDLEYVKEWLPNCYEMFLEILKGAK